MTNYSEVTTYIEKKLELFENLELISESMTLLEVDELLVCIEKRGVLIEEIELVDNKLKDACLSDENLKASLNHTSSRDSFDAQLKNIYDISLKIKAIANRMLQNDENIRQHMAFEKERITTHIEKLNGSSTAAAGKYNKSIKSVVKNPQGVRKTKWI